MSKATRTILCAGSIAGILDIITAFVTFGLRGISPAKILQAIASGLLGAQSYTKGLSTVVLGGALHFLIAFAAAGVYYVVSRRVSFLTRKPILSGLLYGPLVYAFMNGIVVPLSALAPKRTLSVADVTIGVITLSCMVGLPISIVVWNFSKVPSNEPESLATRRPEDLGGVYR